MAQIITMEDLNKRFTEVVSQYLAMGLTMDLNAMSGTQGEIGKVALADNKVVYIIYMETNNIITLKHRFDTMNIKVEMFKRDRRDLVDNWVTYWLGKGELVFEEVYYQSADRRCGKVYVGSEEECLEIRALQRNRREARGDSYDNWKKVKFDTNVIINIIKSRTGRKRVFAENIVKVEKHTGNTQYWKITYVFSSKQDTCVVKAA